MASYDWSGHIPARREAWPNRYPPISSPVALRGFTTPSRGDNYTVSGAYDRLTTFFNTRITANGRYRFAHDYADGYGTELRAALDNDVLISTNSSENTYQRMDIRCTSSELSELLKKTHKRREMMPGDEPMLARNNVAFLAYADGMINERLDPMSIINVRAHNPILDANAEYLLLCAQKYCLTRGVVHAARTVIIDPNFYSRLLKHVTYDGESNKLILAVDMTKRNDANSDRDIMLVEAPQVLNTSFLLQTPNTPESLASSIGISYRLLAVTDERGAPVYDASETFIKTSQRLLSPPPTCRVKRDYTLVYSVDIYCDMLDYRVLKQAIGIDQTVFAHKNTIAALLDISKQANTHFDDWKQRITRLKNPDTSALSFHAFVQHVWRHQMDHVRSADHHPNPLIKPPMLINAMAACMADYMIRYSHFDQHLGDESVHIVCVPGVVRSIMTPRLAWILDNPLHNRFPTPADTTTRDKILISILKEQLTAYNIPVVHAIFRPGSTDDPDLETFEHFSILENWDYTLHAIINQADPGGLNRYYGLRDLYERLNQYQGDVFAKHKFQLAILLARLFLAYLLSILKRHGTGPISYDIVLEMLEHYEGSAASIDAFRKYYNMVVEFELFELDREELRYFVTLPATIINLSLDDIAKLYKMKTWEEIRGVKYLEKQLTDSAESQDIPAGIYNAFYNAAKLDREQHKLLERRYYSTHTSNQLPVYNDFQYYHTLVTPTIANESGKQLATNLDRCKEAEWDGRNTTPVEETIVEGDHNHVQYHELYRLAQGDLVKLMHLRLMEESESMVIHSMSSPIPLKRRRYFDDYMLINVPFSRISTAMTLLSVSHAMMEASFSYPLPRSHENEMDFVLGVNRVHSVLMTLTRRVDATLSPTGYGQQAVARLLEWHRGTTDDANELFYRAAAGLYNSMAWSNAVQISPFLVNKSLLDSVEKSPRKEEDDSDITMEDLVPSTGADESVQHTRVSSLPQNSTGVDYVFESFLDATFNRYSTTMGLRRPFGTFQSLMRPLTALRLDAIVDDEDQSSEQTPLYPSWVSGFEQRTNLFIATLAFYFGLTPADLEQPLEVSQVQRCARILDNVCREEFARPLHERTEITVPLVNRRDPKADTKENSEPSEHILVLLKRLVHISYQPRLLASSKKTPLRDIFGFRLLPGSEVDDDDGDAINAATEWFRSVAASLFFICMTLRLDVLELTSPLHWLALCCGDVQPLPTLLKETPLKRQEDIIDATNPDNEPLHDIDILLRPLFGAIVAPEWRAAYALYVASLPLLYAQAFGLAGVNKTKNVSDMVAILSLNLEPIDLDAWRDSISARTLADYPLHFELYIDDTNKFKKSAHSSSTPLWTRRKEKMVYWLSSRDKSKITKQIVAVPSTITIVRNIMNIDM